MGAVGGLRYAVAAGPEIVVIGGDTVGTGVTIGGTDLSTEDVDGYVLILYR